MADDEEDKRIGDKLLDDLICDEKMTDEAELSKATLLSDAMEKPEGRFMMTKEMKLDAAISANEEKITAQEKCDSIPMELKKECEDVMMIEELNLDAAVIANEEEITAEEKCGSISIEKEKKEPENITMTEELKLTTAVIAKEEKCGSILIEHEDEASEDVMMTEDMISSTAFIANEEEITVVEKCGSMSIENEKKEPEDVMMTEELKLNAAIIANEEEITVVEKCGRMSIENEKKEPEDVMMTEELKLNAAIVANEKKCDSISIEHENKPPEDIMMTKEMILDSDFIANEEKIMVKEKCDSISIEHGKESEDIMMTEEMKLDTAFIINGEEITVVDMSIENEKKEPEDVMMTEELKLDAAVIMNEEKCDSISIEHENKPPEDLMMTKEMILDSAFIANEEKIMVQEKCDSISIEHGKESEDIIMIEEMKLDTVFIANEDKKKAKEKCSSLSIEHEKHEPEDIMMTEELKLDVAAIANEEKIPDSLTMMFKETIEQASLIVDREYNPKDQLINDDDKVPDVLLMAEKKPKLELMLDVVKKAEVAPIIAGGKTPSKPYAARSTVASQPNNPYTARFTMASQSNNPYKYTRKSDPHHLEGMQHGHYNAKDRYEKPGFVSCSQNAHSTVVSQPNNPHTALFAVASPSNNPYKNRKKGEPFHEGMQHGHYNAKGRYKKPDFVSHSQYGRRRQPQETGLGVNKLLEISEMYPERILTTLKCDTSKLNHFLQDESKPDQIVLFVKCLAALSSGHFEAAKSNVLVVVCQSKFIGVLQKYILGLQYAEPEDKARNKFFWDNAEDFYINILKFSGSVIDLSPSTAVNTFRILFDSIKLSLDGLQNYQMVAFTEELVNAFKQIQNKLALCVEEERTKRSQSSSASGGLKEEQPPNDFRDISIMPTKKDLFSEANFLRPNIVDGVYNSVDHYLDVQFRLMREDFIAPLRDSLKEYIHARNKKFYSGARFYKNARLLNYNLKAGVLVVEVCYESRVNNMQKMSSRMINSKRFMYGSLLCLTPDDFKTILFCTVHDRDDIALGKIAVEMTGQPVDEMFDKSYLLVESETYFPPYLHVLKALQNPNMTKEFPFEDYIIGGKQAKSPASMISHQSTGKAPKYTKGVRQYILNEGNSVEEREGLVVSLTEESTWPTPQALGLDESQYNAYKMALTTEFVTIQGPPGTGKTFLGLKIATTILRNFYTEHFRLHLRPILIVCFTNHALDQFLEGLLPVTRDLVRIGGQSKNKNLDQYNLNKQRRYNSENYHLKQQLRQSSLEIEALQALLESLQSTKRVFDVTHRQLTFIESDREVEIHLGDTVPKIFFNCFVFGKRPPLLNWLLMMDRFLKYNQYYAHISQEYGFNYEMNRCEISKDNNSFDTRPLEYSYQQLMFEVEEIERNINSGSMGWKNVKILRTHIKHVLHDVNELKMRLLRGDNGYPEVYFGENSVAQMFNVEERWSLYWNWVNILKVKLRDQHSLAIKKYQQHKVVFDELAQALDLETLTQAHVVGVTTSGAARLQSLLRSLRSPIVIVEEAAEVMESHVVVSLTKDCQHLIMIGDHQQLRPKTATYQMGKKYNLDISLFERMVKNGSHCYQLDVQHRMRPEIARLITPAIYKNLKNNANVEEYPNIKGVAKNLFFIDHTAPETQIEDISSRSNDHEARFALNLAKYFIQQGYGPEEITILATYSGQMFLLRKESKNLCELENVNINILDNYQGEENKIIILSLVRSNTEGNIGFLATNNRVCVALSRAREGFYIIGNMNILVSKSPLWSTVNTTLQELDAIGPSLMLCCEIHKDLITAVKTAEDFTAVPEGGCSQPCGSLLACGHVCKSFCHPGDRLHKFTMCKEICQRNICDLEHECPLGCYEKCLPCKKTVRRTLTCGHEEDLECHVKYLTYKFCRHLFDVELPLCGHQAKRYCHEELQNVKCQEPCKDRLACGHACFLNCHKNKDPDHIKYKCHQACVRLNKGCTESHTCPKECHEPCCTCAVRILKTRSCMHKSNVECRQDVNNSPCEEKCKRSLPCGHFCTKLCKDTCGDCKVKVEKESPCGHKFKMSCSEEPEVSQCLMKCSKTLPCGHPCPKLCWEPCTQSSCKTPVPNPFSSLCKHDFKIRCSMTLYDTEAGPVLTMPYCTHPCGAVLPDCGHTCKGMCGQCVGGRLHVSCREPCGLTLVCGHICEEPCREACPPCTKKCGVKCQHSECPLSCGIPCPTCTHPCQRKCAHGACTKLCGSECDIPTCSETCSKRRECGHACRGLCGELCPQICNVCQPELFPEIFFGNEEDKDARFVKLVDCSHVVEVDGLDRWMEEKLDGQISVPSCPQCKTPIVNTPRYSNLVKQARVKVEAVKKKIFGDCSENKTELHKLHREVLKLEGCSQNQMTEVHLWRRHLKSLSSVVHRNVMLFKGKQVFRLSILEIKKLSFVFETLTKIRDIYYASNKATSAIVFRQMTILLRAIMQKGEILQPNSKELENEICRLERIMDITWIEKRYSKEIKDIELINNLKATVIYSLAPLDDEKNRAICDELNDLRKLISVSLVTDKERSMIVKAMGFKQGHWYMCPNGHAYCITECGGATVRSKCPDCGEVIGGESHTLVKTNKVATFMDGATHSAWSDAANMNNYQMDAE